MFTVQSAIHFLCICIITLFTTSKVSCWPSKPALMLDKTLTKSLNLDIMEYIHIPTSNLHGVLMKKLSPMYFHEMAKQSNKMARKELNNQQSKNKNKNRVMRITAGFVVYRKNSEGINEYLLMKSTFASFSWTPPKGHLELNESDMDAAIRETREETGIKEKDISIDRNFEKVITYEPKHKSYTKQATYWLARLKNPDTPVVLSHEHNIYGWFPIKEAKEKIEYPKMQELLNECEKYLTKTNVN